MPKYNLNNYKLYDTFITNETTLEQGFKFSNYFKFANFPDETEKHRILRKVRHHLYSLVQQQSQATNENLQKTNKIDGINEHSAIKAK